MIEKFQATCKELYEFDVVSRSRGGRIMPGDLLSGRQLYDEDDDAGNVALVISVFYKPSANQGLVRRQANYEVTVLRISRRS